MTVGPSIEPARFLKEELAEASPDLLRELLTTFVTRCCPRRRTVFAGALVLFFVAVGLVMPAAVSSSTGRMSSGWSPRPSAGR
jgi:ABC-type spermidine/putrescine transport system permease subunit I